MKKGGAKRKGASKATRKGAAAAAESQNNEVIAESPEASTQEESQQPKEDVVVEEKGEDEEEEAKRDDSPSQQQQQEDVKAEEVDGDKKKPGRPPRGGGKRKRAATKKEVDEKKPRAKKARVVKPQEEPEYFEDERNLEGLWKAAFPVGTEWDQLDALYEFNWDFKHLEEALEEEGGLLFGKKVFLFGCTELMASSYHEKPQEEEDTFEYHIQDDFDASILTPAQLVMLYELQKEYPGSAKTSLARRIRLELIKDRAELEGREVTKYEFNVAYDLKEVMDWVPPLQLEGIEISIVELQFEKICLPCGENIAHDHDSLVLINECLDLICETRRLDELRIEKLARDHIEVCFDKSYLCASFDLESEFFMLDESSPLLEIADLGDELDVDKLLLEIENPLVKSIHENENIVFYSVDGDRVDYFVKTSFEPVVDFVFPPNAFDSHDHLNLKEHLMIHDISLVKLFDEKSVYYLWTVVCSFAHLVSCSCRRRTKGALAQPFDTYD